MGFLSIIGGGLATVGKWLLRNPTLIAIGLLSAAFILVVIAKDAQISTLDKSINDPKTGWIARNNALVKDNQTLKINNATMSGSLATQSASIELLASQGKLAEAKFNAIINGQALADASTKKRIAALDAAKPGTDKCQSAFDLVRSSVQ